MGYWMGYLHTKEKNGKVEKIRCFQGFKCENAAFIKDLLGLRWKQMGRIPLLIFKDM